MTIKTKFHGLLLALFLVSNLSFAQIHDTYRIKIGNTEVYSLLDGTLELDAEKLFNNNQPGKPSRLLTTEFINNPVEVSINVYLVKIGAKKILIDVGAGELVGSTAGHLNESLRSIGIKPEEITDILLTHIHADHSGGLIISEKKIFPNAMIHVNQTELDFWFSETKAKHASENEMGANPQTFKNAKNMLLPYIKDKQVKTFEGKETEIVPGIFSYSIGGHTPGHTIYVLRDNHEELFFWGDVVHVAAIQLTEPNIMDHFDVDHQISTTARKGFLKLSADKSLLVAGAHISFPGFGRLKKEGKNYIWYPVPYSISGRHK